MERPERRHEPGRPEAGSPRDRRPLYALNRRILEVRPGITSIASLHLRDEEDLVAALDDPDRAYLEALAPFKVLLAMKHVDQGSVWFDINVLVLTLYSVLLGRWWPLSELREVTEFKNHLLQDYGK